MSWLVRRRPKCQLCNDGEIKNFTIAGRKLIPKYFCGECDKRLMDGGKIDVKASTLKKICQELEGATDTASCAAYKLLLLRDPRSADALHAYTLKKSGVPAVEAKLALAALDDPRAEPAMRDELEVDPRWRKLAPNQRTPDSACNGIVVARIEPSSNNELELLTLAKDPREAIGQIADLLHYPSDHPVRTGGLAAIYRPATRSFTYHGLKLFHASPWGGNPRPPEDATLRWADNRHAEESTNNRNMLASNFAGSNESGPTIYGTVVLSGFDVHTATMKSVPLRTLQYDLSVQAYRSAASYVHAWRKERGL